MAACGQAEARRYQAGQRGDQLVRNDAEGFHRPGQSLAGVVDLVAFQVRPGQCDLRGGTRNTAGCLWSVPRRSRSGCEFNSAAEPAPHGFDQRAMPEGICTFAGSGGGISPRIKKAGRIVETAGP